MFFAHSVDDLRDSERRFTLSSEDIALLNPNTRTCAILRSRSDAELTKAICRRVPVLIREAHDGRSEENTWGIKFKLMFMMNTASHLFCPREEMEKNGCRLNGNIFFKDRRKYLPLFEGKLTGLFDHRAGTFEGVPAAEATKGNERETSPAEKSEPSFSACPRYWVTEQDVVDSYGNSCKIFWQTFHDIANPNNERTFIATIIPGVAVGNTLPICLFDPIVSADLELALTSNWNSIVLDYMARLKISSRHFNFFIVKQLPVLPPSTYSLMPYWSSSSENVGDWLLPRALELTYTAWDLEPFAQDCGWPGPPFRWDEERRFLLRCELDAAFFQLYLPAQKNGDWHPAEGETAEDLARLKASFPTPRDAVAYIMDTFPIVRNRDEEKYDGDYRSKRVILEIYDAMADSIRTGQPYQTRLNPPPADPRCCHPARDGALAPGSSRQLSDLMMDPLPRKPFPFQPPAELKARMKSASWMCQVLQATDSLPEQDSWVVVRHPALLKAGTPCGIALGQFRYQRQIDARTGEAFVHVMLRGGQPPAELNIPEAEWPRFLPLAVIQQE